VDMVSRGQVSGRQVSGRWAGLVRYLGSRSLRRPFTLWTIRHTDRSQANPRPC